jgi:hypothetical protein
MNKDFHYYGTYVAACLAGYDSDEAQMIAHSAQYVDDSSMSMLEDSLGNYCITDFVPVPTAIGNNDLFFSNLEWSEKKLRSIVDIWVPFHFLPGNYGKNTHKVNYTGPTSDSGSLFSWHYDDQSKEQFKLLCLPNSILVRDMVNDIVKNHADKDYALQMAGLRMHVMADTWAHMYFAGIPAWFINNAGETVYEIEGGGKETEVKWKRVWPWVDSTDIVNGEMATFNMLAYNSIVYLGHGRMGHLPDYPWLQYKYRPQWSNKDITKDNSTCFLMALKQMTEALRCIREKESFDINTHLPPKVENAIKVIKEVLGSKPKKNDQSEIWKSNIGKIKVNGGPLHVPEDYDKNKWLNEIKEKKEIKDTSYYHFNKSARTHLNFVRKKLKEDNVYFDYTPKENIVETKLQNKKSKSYIGEIDKKYANIQYYPQMSEKGISLEIIKPTGKPLESGDIVEIKTNEPKAGEYNFLGAWVTKALYYYGRAWGISKQKWCIEKVNKSEGKKIIPGDRVRFKNVAFTDKPYMSTYKYSLGGTYLTTQSSGTKDNAIWIMKDL